VKVQFKVVESRVAKDLLSGDMPETGDSGGEGGGSTKRGNEFRMLA